MSGMMTMPDTLSRGDLWDPSHLDLELWLDGTDSTTMDIDASGIAVWKDKSGNGRDVTRSGGTPEFKGRTFRPGGVVSLKAGDTLSAASGLFALSQVTCFVASYVETGADPIQSDDYQSALYSNIVGVTRGNNEWRWGFGHYQGNVRASNTVGSSNMQYYVNNVRNDAPSGGNIDWNAVCITTFSTVYSKIWRNVFSTYSGGGGEEPYGLLRGPNPVELFYGQNISYAAPFWLQVGDTKFFGSVGEIIVMSGNVGEYDPVRAKIEGYLAHKFAQGSTYGPNHSFHNYISKPPYRIWSPADIDVRNQGFWYDAGDAVTEVVSSDPDHYIDATGGKMSEIDVNGVPYILHEFTSDGTFSVNYAGPQAGVEYLVVGAGARGGNNNGGGGGGGGILTNLGGSPYAIEKKDYSVLIGADGYIGGNSIFAEFVVPGGGPGGDGNNNGIAGSSGGGAGGGFSAGTATTIGGSGTPGQGYNGGNTIFYTGTANEPDAAGGGGAGEEGKSPTWDGGAFLVAGYGGNGKQFDITGAQYWYSSGGGGGAGRRGMGYFPPGLGGPGGGDGGVLSQYGAEVIPTSAPNYGGGGGGAMYGATNAAYGKQGVVYIRYPKVNGFTGVKQIPDRSAYARHATQTNPNNYPLIVGNALNKLPIVRAAGNQWLDMNNVAEVTQNEDFVDIYFVAKSIGTSSNNILFDISTPNANDSRLSFEFGTTSNPSLPVARARRLDTDTPIGVQDDNYSGEFDLYQIKASYNSPEGLQLYKNAVLIDSQPFSTLGRTENTPSAIGRLFSATSSLDFAEMLCLKQDGSSEFVEGYLANKWGINNKLPNNHKYRKTEPTFDDIGNPSQFSPFDATGGIITEYEENGRKWRAHTFTNTSPIGNQFMVTQLGQPNFMRVFIGSGGGAGGGSYFSNYPGGGGGAGGGLFHWQQPFESKEYKVYVGAGGVGPRGDEAPAPGGVSYIDGLVDLYRVGNPNMFVEGGGGGGCSNVDTSPRTASGVYPSPGGYSARLGNVYYDSAGDTTIKGLSIPYYTCFRLGNNCGWMTDAFTTGTTNYPGVALGGAGFGGNSEPMGSSTSNPFTRSGHGGSWSGIPIWNGMHGIFGFGGCGGASDAAKKAPKLDRCQSGGGVASDGEPGMNIYGNAGGGAGNNPGASLVGGDGGSGMVIIAYPLEEPLS